MRIIGERGAIYVVTIIDVSKTGLRVSGSVPLTSGTNVTVLCRGIDITGEVRYSRNVGRDEFHLGVKVDDDSEGPRSEEGELDLTLLFMGR
jgi:hypothetical protein